LRLIDLTLPGGSVAADLRGLGGVAVVTVLEEAARRCADHEAGVGLNKGVLNGFSRNGFLFASVYPCYRRFLTAEEGFCRQVSKFTWDEVDGDARAFRHLRNPASRAAERDLVNVRAYTHHR